MTSWVDGIRAIVQAFYPGQEGGTALAQLLFGDFSPSGKLPRPSSGSSRTVPRFAVMPASRQEDPVPRGRLSRLPPLRPAQDQALFPFGHGLSYTTFKYSALSVAPA